VPTRQKEAIQQQHSVGNQSEFSLDSASTRARSSKGVAAADVAHVVVVAAVVADNDVAGRQRWDYLHCPADGCVFAPTRSPSLPSGSHGGGSAWEPIGPPVGSSRNIHAAVGVGVAAVDFVVVERPSSGWTSSGSSCYSSSSSCWSSCWHTAADGVAVFAVVTSPVPFLDLIGAGPMPGARGTPSTLACHRVSARRHHWFRRHREMVSVRCRIPAGPIR